MTTDPVARGHRANAILSDPLWGEAWAELHSRITAAMLAAKTDEGTLRGKQLVGLLIDLRSHFERIAKDGAIAEYHIKLDAEDKKRRLWPFAA